MKLKDARGLVQLRRPTLDPAARSLARCATIADLQAAARRRWPTSVSGYVDGAADSEVTLAANRSAYQQCTLHPHHLRDVSQTDTTCTLLGTPSTLPLGLAPTGYTRMMHTDGERAVAPAATAAGVPYTLSTMSTVSVENIRTIVPHGALWFQLYIWRDRGLVRDLTLFTSYISTLLEGH